MTSTAALVVDDHPVTHLGCRPLLGESGFAPVLSARDGEEALTLFAAHRPSLVVLDLGLPPPGGLELIREFLRQAPETRILVFSMHEETALAARCLDAGAHGYVTKSARPDVFIEAVAAMKAGQPYIEQRLATHLALCARPGEDGPLAQLTRREREVLGLVGKGLAHADIASRLSVSYKTVANTCTALKAKLGARGHPDLIRIAIESKGG